MGRRKGEEEEKKGDGDDGDGKTRWTPSKVISRLGREIDDPSSFCYWAAKNRIPIYCPALTDGSLGDMLYFHSYKNPPGLCIDIVADVRRVNDEALKASPRKTGLVILGGGLPKTPRLQRQPDAQRRRLRRLRQHCPGV